MDQNLIDRINALARKSKEEGLTEQEKEEQQRLRREYIDAYKQGCINTVESLVIVDEKGNRRKINKKKKI